MHSAAKTFALTLCLLEVHAVASGNVVDPGRYLAPSGHRIYIGVEADDTARGNDFYDPVTQRIGDLRDADKYRLVSGVREEPRVIKTPNGALGVSLYYAGSAPRATVILIHGNEAERREMGALIPYLVLNGVNVISYDQRGSGESSGNFLDNGPAQRAADVVAIIDTFRGDPFVDPAKIGVFGYSNGGWTAPMVARQRSLAFLFLGVTPAESIRDNADYEITQIMRQHHFTADDILQALDTWHAIEDALSDHAPWSRARRLYERAKTRPWFAASLLPMFVKTVPPDESEATNLRKLLFFDPTSTLREIRTPTLALYAGLDRETDSADSIRKLIVAFHASGLRDYTIIKFPNADHLLVVSKTGYVDEEPVPNRYVDGYPSVLIDWLRRHRLLQRRKR